MVKKICDKISQDRLVAFADAELSPTEAAQVSEHLNQCESCRAMVEALQRSIELVTASWAAEQARWPKWRASQKPVPNRFPVVRALAVAASILLLLGVGLMWRTVSEPGKPMNNGQAIARLGQKVMQAGTAARMLAIADLLANEPEGREYARNRYMEIAKEFAGTDCAEQAKLRLKSLGERSKKP